MRFTSERSDIQGETLHFKQVEITIDGRFIWTIQKNDQHAYGHGQIFGNRCVRGSSFDNDIDLRELICEQYIILYFSHRLRQNHRWLISLLVTI